MATEKKGGKTDAHIFLEELQESYGGKIVDEGHELYLLIEKDYYTVQTGFSKNAEGPRVKVTLRERMDTTPLRCSLVGDLERFLKSLFQKEEGIQVTDNTSEDIIFWEIRRVETARDYCQTLANITHLVLCDFTHMINAVLGIFHHQYLDLEYLKGIEGVKEDIRKKFLGPIIEGIK
jgi:hypothetical protein